MAARDLKAVVYTDDEGNDYQTWISADVFAQNGVSTNPKVGGADYTGSPKLGPLPAGLKVRGVYVLNGARRKFVVCLEKTSELYSGIETSIDLLELGSAAAIAWTRHRPKGEVLPRIGNPAG